MNPLIMIEFRPLRCIFLYFATRKKERGRLKRRTKREMRKSEREDRAENGVGKSMAVSTRLGLKG